MKTITITGRDSKLSRIQIELVQAQIEQAFPNVRVLVKTCSSLGDRLQHIPLQNVTGVDFFTEDIYQKLTTGEADIAVHSLKDMSAHHFFSENVFAVTHRDVVHDVAIFSEHIIDLIKANKSIVIGTCSPRRELMATRFLKQALPQGQQELKIETKPLRGNVDTRLRKLHEGEFDGIILAMAGLNRLLKHRAHQHAIEPLLQSKKIMVLPLIECTPAPCQGAIVAEALPQNKKALSILNAVNTIKLLNQCIQEKKTALRYGAGCDQKFGVTSIPFIEHEAIFASGASETGIEFYDWHNLPKIDITDKIVWDGTRIKTLRAESIGQTQKITSPVVFVSNNNAITPTLLDELAGKRIWAAGSKTWKKLAKRGLWVEGCADGLGLASLQTTWASALLNIEKSKVSIVTHQTAAVNWQAKGWNATSTYSLEPNDHVAQAQALQIQLADLVFWSSAAQFNQLKHLVKETATHLCASGETHKQITQSGIRAIAFPTLESFQQWKSSSIPSPIED